MSRSAHYLSLSLEARSDLDPRERRLIQEIVGRERVIASGDDMVQQGSTPTVSTVLVEGFAARYKFLPDGGRQVTAVHVPGDFVDLHSFLLNPMDHSVGALTRCVVAPVPHEALTDISETSPKLTRLFWLLTLIDAAIHREWLVSLGRRSATGRLAHFLCEILFRMRAVGLVVENRFDFPFTQVQVADCLGITSVHLNRVLKDLRDRNMIRLDLRQITILDFEALALMADFDPNYLQLREVPR